MTEHGDEFERLLRGVPLRRPTLATDRRVREALVVRPRWPRLAMAAGLAVAVGAAAIAYSGHETAAVPAVAGRAGSSPTTVAMVEPVRVEPVRVERAVSREVSDGVVAVTDNVPYERVRRQTVRETWYVDPKTGARIKVSEPTEEVVLRPVEAY